MSANISLVLDIIMVALLVATIAYAIILNRQIIKLRESRGEMIDLIRGLNDAMVKAETGVRGLKKTATETGEDLQRSVNQAQALRDELSFMIEAGDALANRLGGVHDGPRHSVSPSHLRGNDIPAPRPPLRATQPLTAPPRMSVVDRKQPSAPCAPNRRQAGAVDPVTRDGENLSRAERELLEALENAGKGVG